MSIEYRCGGCGKGFKPRDYMRLETISTSDSINVARRCDSCGKEIRTGDKIVSA